MNQLETITFGGNLRNATRLGLGCWAFGGHGWGVVDDAESIKAIQHSRERGVSFYDTADVYGLGHSEEILCEALGEHRKQVVIASKAGVRWDDSGKTWKDNSPEYLRSALEASLKRLKLECIPLYFLHWPDGSTPISEAMAQLEQFRSEGKVSAIGVCNLSKEQLVEASSVTKIDAMQVQMSILDQQAIEEIIPFCQKKEIKVIAWGSLADGLLTGKFGPDTKFDEDDHRSRYANFQGERLLKNLAAVERFKSIAQQLQVTPAQAALRWVLQTPGIDAVLFGAKRHQQVDDNLGSLGWDLPSKAYEAITNVVSRSAL